MKKLIFVLFVVLLSSCVIIPNTFEVDTFSIKNVKLEFSTFGDLYYKIDVLSLPDIYIEISDENGTIISNYDNYTDVTPEMFPLLWKSSLIQYANKKAYTIKILDKDIVGSDLISVISNQIIDCRKEDQQIVMTTKTGEKVTLTLSPHYRKVEY